MKIARSVFYCFIIVILQLFIFQTCFAQDTTASSNTYYKSNSDKLILRVYLSRKFAPFTISSNNKQDLNYKTNSKLNLGAGFTYKIVTINFAYGFNFLNKDQGRGDTKGLDLQLHVYPRKWAVDILGSFLRGYYLDSKANNGLDLTSDYKRPDLHRNIVGLSLFHVSNYQKFSYKAAFNQTGLQIKSAGSFLYGGSSYYGIVNADSAFVPSMAAGMYTQAGVNKIRFFNIGPGAGYAYTLVVSKHLFATASAIAIAHINITSEEKNGAASSKVKILPGANYKAAIGYNTSIWSVSATFLGDALYTASAASYKEYFVPTGTVNFVIARKLGVGRKRLYYTR